VEGGQSLGSIVEGGQTGRRRITDGPLEQGGYPLVYVLFAVDLRIVEGGRLRVNVLRNIMYLLRALILLARRKAWSK
jgi:hypothetical protein